MPGGERKYTRREDEIETIEKFFKCSVCGEAVAHIRSYQRGVIYCDVTRCRVCGHVDDTGEKE